MYKFEKGLCMYSLIALRLSYGEGKNQCLKLFYFVGGYVVLFSIIKIIYCNQTELMAQIPIYFVFLNHKY